MKDADDDDDDPDDDDPTTATVRTMTKDPTMTAIRHGDDGRLRRRPDDDGDPGDDDDPATAIPATTTVRTTASPATAGIQAAARAGWRRRRPGGAGGRPVLPEVTAPLATLQRRAERPGDNRLLGPLDPALTRDLAAAAARSPHARWEITIVDDHGYAIGHGIARPRRRRRQ